MAAEFVIKRAEDGQFMFNLKAPNGEIILTSELYRSKEGAEVGVASVKENASDDEQYERKSASNGQFYFALKAKNGELIGTSEFYATAESREKGIASVKRNAPGAKVAMPASPTS
jgi:uncharacterized protein YegP (UPF0339 family)